MGSGAPACDVHSRASQRGAGWGRKCRPGQLVLRLTSEMSITTVRAVNNDIRDKLRRISWHHPEWWVVMAAAVAWMFMAGVSLAGMSHPHASHSGISPVGMSQAHISHTHVSHTRIILGRGHGQGMLGTVAMVIAMMLPLTLANIRHVALNSLWRRRHRAISAFLVGYLAVWIVVQAVIVGGTWGLLAPLIGWETEIGRASCRERV